MLSPGQYSALQLCKDASEEIIKYSKEVIFSLLASENTYEKIVSILLPEHVITTKALASTRRGALLMALSEMKNNGSISEKELLEYSNQKKALGGKKAVKKLYEVHGTTPLSKEEKYLLLQLKELNPFIKGSQLDLTAIQKFWHKETGIVRSKNIVSKRLRHGEKKKEIIPYSSQEREKIIFYYNTYKKQQVSKRLPAGIYNTISIDINKEFNNKRSSSSIETFIHDYLKEQKTEKNPSILRSTEETNLLKSLLNNNIEGYDFYHKSGTSKGKIKWDIFLQYFTKHNSITRSKRSIQHMIADI